MLHQVYDELQTSPDVLNSAQKELNAYTDSIEGHTKKFTNAVQEMWSETLDTDVIKWFIDLGTAAVNMTTKLGGVIPVATSVGAALASLVKNVGREKCYPSNMPTRICSLSKGLSLEIRPMLIG